jgi:uncharacterized protein (DUF1015 family)
MAAVPAEPPGLVLAPFRALRYDMPRVGSPSTLTSPPYDVLDDAAVRDLEERDEHNVVRLILPRAEDGEPDRRYGIAADRLARWRREGVLRTDQDPALYAYEETDMASGHVQRGLLGTVGLARPETGVILPHENTMAGPVADRLALTEATGTNLEPIFLVYDGQGVAAAAVETVLPAAPLVDGEAGGERHRVWAVTDPDVLAAVAADLLPRRAVIADGHHRYATYLRYQEARYAEGSGPGPWDRGLALLVDASVAGPRVEAIHRVLTSVAFDVAVGRARDSGVVQITDLPAVGAHVPTALTNAGRERRHAFVLAGDGRAVLLSDPDPRALAGAVGEERSVAWRRLDVTVLHRWLLPAVLGVEDTEQAVGFEHSVHDALALAASTGGTALLLNPTPVADVLAVAAAGERMPRKSTLFTPKPRTGLVIRALSDDGT